MGQFRFTKKERLLKRGDFLAVSKNPSRRIKTDHFLLLVKPNQLPQARLGITASKKVGSAVKRNRVKRRVREFFRTHKHFLPAGLDLLIIVSRGAADMDADSFEREQRELIRQAIH
ncbi:MAG: ribonuclease P protein component [Deltaproteobacteria bacterium]|nr:ribonuclease P protein component [Deltaproteobacteria bacterium]MBW2087090.1 ribonuclease P protein component [Deltaproteobacteria bacterium]